MVGVMLMTINERERQILTMAFNQLNIQTTQSDPSYANYIKTLQYQPDIIVLEVPRMNHDQVHFSRLIRKNKKTRKIPIIGYGDRINESQKRYLSQKGINNYLERPLKFTILIGIIQKYLKILNKSLETESGDKSSEREEDIKLILDDNTLPVKKIELMVKHIGNMMAFPFTVAKVLRLTESNKSGASDLAKVIEADPVISTSILKVSNTVFFASMNRRISTIKDAIVRIGFRETKRIVMTMSVMDLFGKEDKNFGFNKMNFWLHSLATALIAERVAKRMGDVSTDEAFLAGLLHDFGILLFDEFYPTIFSKILEETSNTGTRFIDNERKILKITRNDLLKELFTNWKIPETITEAITVHYSSCDGEKKPGTPVEKIALSTYMGNIIAKTFSCGAVCDEYITPIENVYFEAAKMPGGLGKDFYESLMRDLNMYKKFLNIQENETESRKDKKAIGIFCPVKTVFVPVEEYFKAQGQSVIRLQKAHSYTDYDQKLDIIFIWAGKKTTMEAVRPLASIIQHTEEEIDATKEPPLTPLCTILYKETPLATDNDGKISFMYNEFDLRQLEANMTTILDGNRVVPAPQAAPAQADSTTDQESDVTPDSIELPEPG